MVSGASTGVSPDEKRVTVGTRRPTTILRVPDDVLTSLRPDAGTAATVAVVICAYTERRWTLLSQTVQSVLGQRRPADEVVLVIDHNPALLARAAEAFRHVQVVANEEANGLSGARNTGIRRSTAAIVAFVDDDAIAATDWLERLLAVFQEPEVMGAGGTADPVWDGKRPRWLPEEFLWVVGASYRGLPVDVAPIRNPIGANMAFRREAFDVAGRFTDGIGRVGRTPLGCEETEFTIRLRQAVPGAVVLYVPDARVAHHVAPDRGTWRYFASRCWAEGASKALVTALVGAADGLSSERSYVGRTLPRGFVAGIADAARGDRSGLGRSAALFAGLAITTAGYVRGRFATAPSEARATRSVAKPGS